ncbi:MAG: VanZ family protein [Pseudomonadota bacterium]
MTPPATGGFQKKYLLAAGIVYLAFVIYGSLVPLDFHHRNWEEARLAFSRIRYLDLGIQSRADWVANILLFIPLAFLWLGLVWHPRNWGARILASVFILATCAALSIGIEFTQLFFPPRTVSQNDIVAETAGAGIGIVLWWSHGERMSRFVCDWLAAKGNRGTTQRLLYVYLFFLFGYNLLPLDLTISPVEIYHKWREGRVILIPFGFVFADPAQEFYGLVSDMAIWAPAAFLWRLSSSRKPLSILLLVIGAAVLLEFLQLFVYSRVSNVTQIITAALGASAGVALANLFVKEKQAIFASMAGNSGAPRRRGPWLALIVIWLAVLACVFWYPFNFQFSQQAASAAVPGFFKVPFIAYYYGTEYRAVTEVLHKTGFFFPLGLVLAIALPRRPHLAWVLTGLALAALGIEAGQALLPGKHADITDWILETAGALAGYLMMYRILSAGPGEMPLAAMPHVPEPAPDRPVFSGRMWPSMAAIFVVLVAGFWFVTHSSHAPYNVRKLLVADHPLLSLGLLAGFTCWTIGFPAWIAVRDHVSATRWPFVLMVACHAVVAWILIRFAVPLEMIEKIAASPVLGLPWEWELIGRFIALFGIFSVALALSAMASRALFGLAPFSRLFNWLLRAVVLLPVLHWVVITNAATDNLTELIAHSGSLGASFLFMVFLIILTVTGSSLAVVSSGRRSAGWAPLWLAGLLILSFPLAYFTLSLATEQFVIKYGKVFSALQFLLSSDREHYAASTELFIRYAIFHAAVISTIAFVQRPLFFGSRPGRE